MTRAPKSGITLTDKEASIVKGMLARGDRQHDIAAYFGVNGGRIAEIRTGDTFAHVSIQNTNLPAPGPYLNQASKKEVEKIVNAIESHIRNSTDKTLQSLLKDLKKTLN